MGRVSVTLLSAAIMGMAAPAAGQVTFYNVCTPGAFKVCASAEVMLSGGNLVMRVWNMNQAGLEGAPDRSAYYTQFGGWHSITAVGLSGIGYQVAAGGAQLSSVKYVNGSTVTSLSKWGSDASANQLQIYNTGADTQGHKEAIVGCSDPGPASAGHVATCNTYPSSPYVEFTFAGLLNIDLSNPIFEFHGQQVAYENCSGRSSEECYFGNSLKGAGPPTTPPATEAVPEPVTTLLLATGLLGVGGAARRSRARRALEEERA